MDIRKEFLPRWKVLRKSSRYRDLTLFLLFIIIAALFWFIMVINDSVEETFSVRLNVYNKPDSVTFITDPPSHITVTVRDRGTQLLRGGFSAERNIDINFKEFASGGVLRCPNREFYRLIRSGFGSSSQILSSSIDSLKLVYTTLPGKRVPVDVVADVSASLGNVVSGPVIPSQKFVLVYSDSQTLLDTVYKVYTKRLIRKNIKETTKIDVKLAELQGARIIPPVITLTVPVEALVNKSIQSKVSLVNAPAGVSVLLFPSMVETSFYLPLGKFNSEVDIKVEADYRDIGKSVSNRIPLRVKGHAPYVSNVSLKTDSVEYTVITSN